MLYFTTKFTFNHPNRDCIIQYYYADNKLYGLTSKSLGCVVYNIKPDCTVVRDEYRNFHRDHRVHNSEMFIHPTIDTWYDVIIGVMKRMLIEKITITDEYVMIEDDAKIMVFKKGSLDIAEILIDKKSGASYVINRHFTANKFNFIEFSESGSSISLNLEQVNELKKSFTKDMKMRQVTVLEDEYIYYPWLLARYMTPIPKIGIGFEDVGVVTQE